MIDNHVDSFQSMKRKERNYHSIDYLGCSTQHDSIFLHCIKKRRTKLVGWCYRVTDYFQLDRDIVEIAISNFDRFLLSRTSVIFDQQQFQLAAMTSLYTAIKIHAPRVMPLKVVSIMSKNRYSEKQIAEMEQEMIIAVGWYLNPPSTISFVNCYLSMITSDNISEIQSETIRQCSKIQVEVALMQYYFVSLSPSYIALAALANSLEITLGEFKHEFLGILSNISGYDISSDAFKSTRTVLSVIFKGTNIKTSKDSFGTRLTLEGVQSIASASIYNSPRSIVS